VPCDGLMTHAGIRRGRTRFASLAGLAQQPRVSWEGTEPGLAYKAVGGPQWSGLGFLNPEAWFASLAALAQLLSGSWGRRPGFAYRCLGAPGRLGLSFLNLEARFASLASPAQLSSESWSRGARACLQEIGPPMFFDLASSTRKPGLPHWRPLPNSRRRVGREGPGPAYKESGPPG